MGKVVGIIQARMGSTRFPGKVLKKIIGVPIICHVLKNSLKIKNIDELFWQYQMINLVITLKGPFKSLMLKFIEE